MKWGLGQSYDRVVISRKARAYADLTKPASSVGVSIAFALGSLFYFFYTDSAHLIGQEVSTIIYAVVTVGLAHGASQAMNMAEDAEMDAASDNKENRPIPAGIVSEEEARTLAWIFIFVAVGRAYLVNGWFGIFMSILCFMGVFYNLSPIRAKNKIISIPWQAVSRGLLSFPLLWSAYGSPWEPFPWMMGLFMFFYVLGFQNTSDIADRYIDDRFNVMTFVVAFGVRKTVIIAFGCMMMMATVVVSSVALGVVEERFYWLLAIIPFCLYMLIELWYNPYEISDMTGNHPMWLWFYGGMVYSFGVPLLIEYFLG